MFCFHCWDGRRLELFTIGSLTVPADPYSMLVACVCVCAREETPQLILFLLVGLARTSHHTESSEEDLWWQQVTRGLVLGTGAASTCSRVPRVSKSGGG